MKLYIFYLCLLAILAFTAADCTVDDKKCSEAENKYWKQLIETMMKNRHNGK